MPRQLITIPRNPLRGGLRVLYVDAAGATRWLISPRQIGAQPCRAGWEYRIFGGLEQPALAVVPGDVDVPGRLPDVKHRDLRMPVGPVVGSTSR